ncbi:type II secretion system F family protein [Aliarcobacter lanthieri]|uniref:type II secretion system F family protein n=1 Tax=Aliarcobacter lanthieri TaxID=1355374 RepID=UPI00047E58C9|nr:type II secretion system F family protein [Aliarcobacter lanthieri]QKF59809.1 type II secretion/transformation system, F protein [Aliarcobacter lanthieri]
MKKYKIKYQENGEIKSKVVTIIELEKQNISKNILEVIEQKSFSFSKKITINDKSLRNLFYELNLMLKANINISESLEILIKNRKDKNIIEFLQTINYALSNSKPIIKELEKFKIDENIKAFLNISQNSSNIDLNFESIYSFLDESLLIKKSFYKAISYPIFLTLSFFISIISIFLIVIPNFKSIFMQIESNLPLATRILLKLEYFFSEFYVLLILIPVLLIILFKLFYNYSKSFSSFVTKMLLNNIPIISNIYLNFELYKLFLVIDIMQKSKYEFHKAFQTSHLLLKNKYLLDKICSINNLLENGKTISYSFSKSKIFDDIVLNLLTTGEVSNSLELTICEIKKIYKNRFDESINFLILLIQPIFLIFMACLILFIVIAIFTPIWDMGNIII